MNYRSPLIICVGLVVVLAAYFLGRAQAPAPPAEAKSEAANAIAPTGNKESKKTLPATSKAVTRATSSSALPGVDAPLKNTFADLQARAAAGDAAAATRLSRDLGRCSRLRSTLWKNGSSASDLVARKTDGMT